MVTSRERMENGISKYWKEYVSCCIWRTKQEKCKTSLWSISESPFFFGKGWVVFFLGPHQWNLKYLKSLSPMLVWATARRSKCMKTWSVPLAILQAKTIQVLIHDSCTPKWLSAKPQLERTVCFVRNGCDQICMSFEWCSTTLCLHHSSLYPGEVQTLGP